MSNPQQDLNKLVLIILSQNQAIKDFLWQINAAGTLFAIQRKKISIPMKVITDFILKWTDDSDEIRNIKADAEFNQFVQLIFNAIVESPEFRTFINHLEKQNILEPLMATDIEIDTQTLIRFVIIDPNVANRKRLIMRRTTPQEASPPMRQQIDGIWLTDNEEIFEEYCIEHFNEKWWMKKHRLTLAQIKKTDQT